MAHPAEEIATVIVARLNNVTVENGYAFDVAGVHRPNRDGSDWTPKPNTMVVEQSGETRNESHDRPGNPPALAYTQAFEIQGFVRQSDRSTTPDATVENSMALAIKKAVAAGASDWHQFGGSSYDASWGETSPYTSTDHAGVTVQLVVYYRVSELDPNVVRN